MPVNDPPFRWSKPRSRDFGALSAIQLYGETLQIAEQTGFATADLLMSPEQGLLGRRAGRLFHRRERLQAGSTISEIVVNPTKTNIKGLLSILHRFDWINPDPSKNRYYITAIGKKVAQYSSTDPKTFRRIVAKELNDFYKVPGWFIERLYRLNPSGNGQIILPAPLKFTESTAAGAMSYSPHLAPFGIPLRLPWKDAEWKVTLDRYVLHASSIANKTIPGSFPIPDSLWIDAVKRVWERLGQGRPPKKAVSEKEVNDATFSVRQRLFHCMREAAIDLLFGATPPNSQTPDFISLKHPIPYRAFTVWCPRLAELEFIFYTDFHPKIHGRLLVPCGAFRKVGDVKLFEELPTVKDPDGRSLFLHQPVWQTIDQMFLRCLESTYKEEAQRVGSIYVSLLLLRDEVCRRLQISALKFDEMLLHAYESSVRSSDRSGRTVSISLETDVRPDQLGAVGQNQRPIYINGIAHSLIALGVRSKTIYEPAPSEKHTPDGYLQPEPV